MLLIAFWTVISIFNITLIITEKRLRYEFLFNVCQKIRSHVASALARKEHIDIQQNVLK